MQSGKHNNSLQEIQRRLELTNRQVLAYSRDFARIYRQEKEQRLMLEEMHLKLQAIVNSMSDAMVATDENFLILECNSSFAQILPSIRTIANQSLTKLIPQNVLQKYVLLLKKESQNSVSFEFSSGSKQNTIYWISLSRIQNFFKKQTGYVFLFRDITEIKKFEKLKRNFITLASQEIQAPLNGLLGLLHLLYENISGKLTDEERSYYSFLINSGKSLQSMFEEMMQISPVHDVDELRKCFVQLEGVVLKALNRSERDVKSLEIQIQFELTDKGAILADPDLLFKAISAIITNLIAYTKQDGKIEIEQLQIGEELLLQFRCHNISRDDWKELHYMFNAPNKFQDRFDGTGVGLALAKEIVEWNGGQVMMKQGNEQQVDLIFPAWSKVVGVSSKQE